jgi:hypothetical protein
MIQSSADNSADARIHTGGIAAGSQNTNSFNAHSRTSREIEDVYVYFTEKYIRCKVIFSGKCGFDKKLYSRTEDLILCLVRGILISNERNKIKILLR